jgi:hypothetical protein
MMNDGYRPILIKEGDRIISVREQIKFLMLKDLVCGDVPYCLIQGNKIYWEPGHELMAQK